MIIEKIIEKNETFYIISYFSSFQFIAIRTERKHTIDVVVWYSYTAFGSSCIIVRCTPPLLHIIWNTYLCVCACHINTRLFVVLYVFVCFTFYCVAIFWWTFKRISSECFLYKPARTIFKVKSAQITCQTVRHFKFQTTG